MSFQLQRLSTFFNQSQCRAAIPRSNFRMIVIIMVCRNLQRRKQKNYYEEFFQLLKLFKLVKPYGCDLVLIPLAFTLNSSLPFLLQK